MANETGSILVDHGWLRLLGARSALIQDGLPARNGLAVNSVSHAHSGAGPRTIFYFAPDTLDWMETSSAGFPQWAITQAPSAFYADLRWPKWEQEGVALDGDHRISVHPML